MCLNEQPRAQNIKMLSAVSDIEVVFVFDERILWYEYVDSDLHRLDFEYCKGCV